MIAKHRNRRWLSAAALLGLLALLAAHGLILQAIASHAGLSTASIFFLVLVVVIKHVGLFGPAWAALTRYFRPGTD